MYPALHPHIYMDIYFENMQAHPDLFAEYYRHTTSDRHNPSASVLASAYSIHGRFLQSGYLTLPLIFEVLLRSASYFLYM